MKNIKRTIVSLLTITTDKRKSKDTEASTGPKVLITVNIHKVTPSDTVMKKLKLENKEKQFNFSVIDREDGNGEKLYMHNVETDGYVLGTNGTTSAPDLVKKALAVCGLTDEKYKAEESDTRSFNMAVDFNNPLHVYFTADGTPFDTQEEADAHDQDNHVETYFPMTYIGDVVRVKGEPSEDDDALEGGEKVEPKKRGRKSKADKANAESAE